MKITSEITAVNIIDLYSKILSGEIHRFPNGTWEKSESGKRGFIRCFRWLVLTKLNMSKDQIIKQTRCQQFFTKYKLATPYATYANSSYYSVLTLCFPEWEILPWELSRVPSGFYDSEDNRRWVLRWLAFDKLKLTTKEEVLDKITSVTIYEHGFFDALDKSENLHDCLSNAFPEFEIKEHEVRIIHREIGLVIQSIRNYIDNVLGWDREEIENQLTRSVIESAGFGNVLITHFDSSTQKLLNAVYPEFSWKSFKLSSGRKKNYNSKRKLSCEDVSYIENNRGSLTIKELMSKFNVSETTILSVFNGSYKPRT